MADALETGQEAPATPAVPAAKKFRVPIEHDDSGGMTMEHGGKKFKIPVEYATMDAPKPTAAAKPDYSYAKASAYNPSWWEKTKNVLRYGAGEATSDAGIAGSGGSKLEEVRAFANHPLAAIEELFPNNPKSTLGRVAKGASKAVSGMTSPFQIATFIAPMSKLKTAGEIIHAVGTAMMPTMLTGTADSIKKIKAAKDAGNVQEEDEAWGEMAGNLAMMAGMHGIGMAHERIGHAELNVEAQDRYKKPFRKLDDDQKTEVLYASAENANPKLKKKVDEELQRIGGSKVEGQAGLTRDEVSKLNAGYRPEVNAAVRDGRAGKLKDAAGVPKPIELTTTERDADSEARGKQSVEDIRRQGIALRRQAFNNVMARETQRIRQEEEFKQAQAHAEQQVRQSRAAAEQQLNQERAARAAQERATVEAPTTAEQRGFVVDDQRHYDLGLQRENLLAERENATGAKEEVPVPNPEVAQTAEQRLAAYKERNPGANVDTPPAAGEQGRSRQVLIQRASELERPVQEYAEQNHGASFSSLPLAQQEEVAQHFMRNEPEKWDAFKATQPYDAYRRHAEATEAAAPAMARWASRGEATGEPLADGADVMSGVARLISARTDVAATFKANPRVYRDVSAYSEQAFGKGYDMLDPEQKPTALAGFLRKNPDQVGSFVTPDIAEAIHNGQHIDLANIEASLIDKQQVSMLMQHRDETRAAVDRELSGAAVDEARSQLRERVQRVVQQAAADNSAASIAITDASRGLTRLADRITIDGTKAAGDVFQVESAIRKIPVRDRTGDMTDFMSQMRRMRQAAEAQTLREYREGLVKELRADAPTGRVRAAREVVHFEEQRHTMTRMADALDGEYALPEQKAEAQELREAADYVQRQEDEVVAAAEVAREPEETAEDKPKPVIPETSIPATMGRESRVKLNSGEEVPVHYAVVEADSLITSHQSTNGYVPDPRYPQAAQPRDYEREPELQAATEVRANKLDADVILSDSVYATEGSPIIREDGVVISANGRTQSVKLAIKRGNYDGIRNELLNRAERFGIPRDAVAAMKDPVLVRVMDERVTDTAALAKYGLEMNRGSSQGMSEAEQMAAFSRLVTPEVTQRLANIFSSLSGDTSLRTAMRMRSNDIANVMQNAGIIDPVQRSAFVTPDGDLTERAKELVENTLAGMTVTNPAVVRRATPAIKDKLGRVGMDFVKMQAAGDSWNIASHNTEAVELLTRALDQATYLRNMEGRDVSKEATGGDSLIERMLHPDRYRLSNFGMFEDQATHAPIHPATEALAMLMEDTPRQYAGAIRAYADAADSGGATMFGAMHPSEAFNQHIAEKFGLNVDPEEWGMVGAMPDEIKAAVQEAREPMPVEPAVHAETVFEDIAPDSSSVTEAVNTREAKNVAELRRELGRMQNITEDQAQALGDFAEHVLPRALGESLDSLMNNYRLRFVFGGEEGRNRGYTEFVNEAHTVIRMMDTADPSTFLHETAHFLRKMLSGADQATANEFVGAKPGEEWSVEQEEQFAQAFERYHFDGGRRKGKLDKAFAIIHKAMQAVYDLATGSGLAKGNEKLNAMFDNWYDWTRKERQSITDRNDVAAIEANSKSGTVTVPDDAKMIDGTTRLERGARTFVFGDLPQANDFIDRNNKIIRTYQVFEGKDGTIYVKANAVGKRLYQPGTVSIGDLARQAREIEARLKTVTDPREEAALRAKLNQIDNKLGVSTFVFGRSEVAPSREVTELSHGIGEMPHMEEPTTPAQAAMVRQVVGDPTQFEEGGRDGRENPELRNVPDEAARVSRPEDVAALPESAGSADGRDETSGRVVSGRGKPGGQGGKDLATPEVNPLAKMPAAVLKTPTRPRGTPVVDADSWRGYAEALGLPAGTPPPTVRLPEDLREMMIYPGQPEAIEVALSALQQHDGVVVAAPTGSGKTYMSLAIADQLLGTEGNKVGLIVTKSRNLISDSDGYIDVGKRIGVEVEHMPQNPNEVQGGGVYAASYAKIRGNKGMLGIPWDFVIFDESAEGRKWMESSQAKAVIALGHASKKAVYVSATPFHTAIETGYMHKLGLWPQGGFFEWAHQFGVVETGPNSYTSGYAPKKLMKLRQQLIERGQWVGLSRDMDGVSAHVGLVELSPEVQANVKTIRDVFTKAGQIFKEQGNTAMARVTQTQVVPYLKRYIEGARLPQAIEFAKRAIEDGWSPIIYSEYRSGTENGMDFFKHLPPGVGDHLNSLLPPIPDHIKMIREQLGDSMGVFAGGANELRSDEREQFMRGQKKGLYATYAAGGVGVSFHDRIGDRPRMGIFLGPPWSGIMFEQSLGRTWRYGVRSDVANIFLTSNALPEMKVLATKVLPRMRALNAAVYGLEHETEIAKRLRQSVGLNEEAIAYEMGNEAVAEAAHFEHVEKDHGFTRFEDLEMPKASAAKNRGMKYRQPPKRLYQGPKDENPFSRDAQKAAEDLLKDLPTFAQRPFRSSFAQIHAEIADEGRKAFQAGEPPKPAMERAARDVKIGLNLALSERGLIAAHGAKKNLQAMKDFAKEWTYIRHTAGEQTIRKVMADAGFADEGREVQRRLIERSHIKANFQGDLLSRVSEIIKDITPKQHEQVVRVLEGKAVSSDPAVNEAADGYRKFFAHVRRTLGDAGAQMKFYDQGKEVVLPYTKIADDPHYWPHVYDWNKPILLNGEVTTLGEIHDMPTSEAKRDTLIKAYAKKRGITFAEADKFFAKNRRGIRLAGNLEKGREANIPDYDMTQRGLSVYIDQVAGMLANLHSVGQEREKLNPMIYQLPADTQRVVNSIVTADLNPQSIGESNKRFLRLASQWTVLSKMGFSALKLPFHMAKSSLVTNTRSLVGGILGLATHPREMVTMARDAGVLTDYVRQAMMMEYGLHSGGLDQKMLTATGFTAGVYISRITAAASGRVFLERYAVPALMKDSENPELRRKLKDLYAFSDDDLSRMAHKGYNADDVKRAMVAAADWTTGSGRPSELPPAVRYVEDHPISKNHNAFMRLVWQLKTFEFKTANLVNRTVFEGLKQGGLTDWKSKEYKAVGRWLVSFGAAGLGLRMMQIGVQSVSNPAAAEEEKERLREALHNPKSALFMELGNVSYGMGIYPAKVMFDYMASSPAERKKMNAKRTTENALSSIGRMTGGVLGEDFGHAMDAVLEWSKTFMDDGTKHKHDAGQRRSDLVQHLVEQEFAPSKMLIGAKHAVFGDSKPASSGGDLVIPRRKKRGQLVLR